MKPDYPLKFKPILKERIWGGTKLHTVLNKEKSVTLIGESWEISAIPQSVSVVENGFLKGKNLQELIDENPKELLGDSVLNYFGKNFPLLIKFIDAKSDLSIQLHPNDTLASKRHQSLGKEEMWYILNANPESRLMFGFNTRLNKDTYINHVENNTLESVLQYEKVKSGDVFHIPAGSVHAIGAGILLAEIQQSSDITYRIYDWNRMDDKGNLRELHSELALDAINFNSPKKFKIPYTNIPNKTIEIVKGNYFTTNMLDLNQPFSVQNSHCNTFIIYIGVAGSGIIKTDNDEIIIQKGESLLIPACLMHYSIIPDMGGIKLLQVIP